MKYESIVFTSPTLQVSIFEGRLARKLHFHNFDIQSLREVRHESFEGFQGCPEGNLFLKDIRCASMCNMPRKVDGE